MSMLQSTINKCDTIFMNVRRRRKIELRRQSGESARIATLCALGSYGLVDAPSPRESVVYYAQNI